MRKPKKKRSYPTYYHIGIHPDVGKRLERVRKRVGGSRKLSWTYFFSIVLQDLESPMFQKLARERA